MRGSGAAVAPVAGGLPPIGRGQAAAPKSPSSPAASRSSWQPTSRRLTNSCSASRLVRGIGQGRNGPARRGAPLNARAWTPRELRHSFVSLLSDSAIPVEEISRLVGHKSTVVTELVYREQIRPVVQSGAEAMDQIFGADDGA